MKTFYVYILASQARGTLYIGITNDISRRYFEHTRNINDSFTKKYNVKRLVYVEQTDNVEAAIAREKQLKNWHRRWKINLIEASNPHWNDLAATYGIDAETSSA